MIIGEGFLWLHLPKTGGDITRELFLSLNEKRGRNFIKFFYNSGDPKKHIFFEDVVKEFKVYLLDDFEVISNFRRLPEWVLSFFFHMKRFGPTSCSQEIREFVRSNIDKSWIFEEQNHPLAREFLLSVQKLDSPCIIRMPDFLFDKFNLSNSRILRVECLKEDFVNVLSPILDLEEEEINFIRSYKFRSKRPNDYDHNVFNFFTREEIKILYDSNPKWAELERKLYGGLMI